MRLQDLTTLGRVKRPIGGFLFLIMWLGSELLAPSRGQTEQMEPSEFAQGVEYSLLMSKDDTVCKPLMGIVIKHITVEGRIDSETQGTDLGLVSWEPIEIPYNGSTDQVLGKALVDINNDGKKELVVRDSGFMHSVITDRLFIFPPSSDVLSKLRSGAGGLGPLYSTPNKLDFVERGYALKDLPIPIRKQLLKALKENLSEPLNKGIIKEGNLVPASTGGPGSVLEPFAWKNTAYIMVTNRGQEWIVISKYISRSTLEDICYFYGPNRIKPD